VHAPGDVSLDLGGNCSRLTATVGVDDEVGDAGSVTFAVQGDGRTLAATGTLTGASAPVELSADLTGVRRLDLVTGDGGDGNGSDHADWAGPTLVCAGGS
jgi:hypothetical protein